MMQVVCHKCHHSLDLRAAVHDETAPVETRFAYHKECFPAGTSIFGALRSQTSTPESELSRLTSENERLRDLLGEVMGWIDNWDPNFAQDEFWPETKQKVAAALHPQDKGR